MAIHSHKFRSALITSLAVLVICVALIFSGFRLIVLLVSDYADDIEHEINQLLGMPVSIQKLDADIDWLSPRLKLINVDFYNTKGKLFLHSDEINLSLNWLASFKSLQPELGVISLSGTQLDIQRQKNGEFLIQGFPLKTSNSSEDIPLEAQRFLANSSIFIKNSRLHWQDKKHQKSLELSQVEVAMVNNIESHQLAISFDLPKKYGKHLTLRAQLHGRLTQPETLSGKVYGLLDNIKLQSWFADYGMLQGFNASGTMNAETWISFENKKIKQLSGVVHAQNLQLDILQAKDKHHLNLETFSSRIKWQQKADNWQLQLSDIQLQRNNKRWPEHADLNMQFHAKNQLVQFEASFLRSEDVLAVSQFIAHFVKQDMLPPLVLIRPYQLKGDLSKLSLFLPVDDVENFRFSSQFNNLSFFETKQNIRVAGFDGDIRARINAAEVSFKTQQAELLMPSVFRKTLKIRKLEGELTVHKDKTDWYVLSDNILMNTPYFSSQTKLTIVVDKQLNINSNIHSAFKNGDLANLRHYLPASMMDEALVSWLENSVLQGRLVGGEFILHGELNKFPFKNDEGVLEAVFNIKNGRLKYLQNWPQINDISANFVLTQKGLQINALQGKIGEAKIINAQVSIDDFQQSLLTIQGNVQGTADDYIQFIANSELSDSLSYLAQIKLKGDASLKLNINVPLGNDDDVGIVGDLKFNNNELFIPSEKFRFKHIQGSLSFTESSVSAKNIKANLAGYPLQININDVYAGQDHYTQITSNFTSTAKSLLVTVPELQAYFLGESFWNVDIKIPLSVSDEVVAVQIKSNLNGISSHLPAPFSKTSATQSDFVFNLSLNNDDHLFLNARMSDDMQLSAQLIDGHWQTKIDAKNIIGQASFANDFAEDTLAKINLEYLDLTPYTEGEDEDINISPMDIPPLDVTINKLKLKKMNFTDLKLQTSRNKNGMYIQQLALKAKGVSARLKGSWMSSWRHKNHTQLNINLDFNDLGKCLKDLKISQAIYKGKGSAELDWQWEAEPYAFNWDLLAGKGTFNIKDGRLNDVNAGAGRLLGVLNFKTLLSLDFGRQVSDGFPFDRATGDMVFMNGNAQVKRLNISSKVADVDIKGRIGLSAEDLDQVFTVKPGVGSSLTMIGAVAGGPVAAVWIHLFQKMFSVDEIAEYTYTVKGSWDDPQVKLISAPEQNDTVEQDLSDDQ